jgi:hypothetical protein
VEVTAGRWRLRAEVPGRIMSLAAGADDETAAAEHAAVARRWLPPDAPERARDEALAHLAAARERAARGGLGYLGVLTGQVHGRPRMVMLGIAATTFRSPAGVEPGSLLAALLRHQYPPPSALVEEFETPHGPAVGVRRCDRITLPARPRLPAHQDQRQQDQRRQADRTGQQADGHGQQNEGRQGQGQKGQGQGQKGQGQQAGDASQTIEAGISQALVIFPEAGLLGTVTGFCPDAADLDLAAVFTARIAHGLTVVQAPGRPSAQAPVQPAA